VRFGPRCASLWIAAWFLLLCGALRASALTASKTSLTISSGGNTVTSVASGSVVTLTAAVTAGGSPVTVGQVFFCDASAKSCTDIHLLGVAQLTNAGSATMKFVPGIGSHSYKALFAGTPNGTLSTVGSSSSNVALTVTGLHPTTTTIASGGSAGNYTLTATVTGSGSTTAPSASVSFVDTTNANSLLGTAVLGASTTGFSFLNSDNLPTANNAWIVVSGDFNGDGFPDLAVSNYAESMVSIYLGKGDGTFVQAPNSPFGANCNCQYMVVGDFNGDGKPDLVLQGSGHSAIDVLLGNGDGTFTPTNQVITTPSPYAPAALAVGDFNGDGIPDLAQTFWTNVSFMGGGAYTDYVMILLGNGDGTFTSSTNIPLSVAASPFQISAGDFNGDGNLDLAVANYRDNNISIFLGKGDGTFTQASNSPVSVGSYPQSIAVGDLNGDGVLDLAVVNSNYSVSLTGSVSVLLGNGDGTFSQVPDGPYAVGGIPRYVAVGDFNGDGKGDLAVNSEGDAITILLGAGNGSFTRSTNSPITVGDYPEALAVADYNGDGISDLAVANSGSTTNTVLLSQVTQTATASMTSVSILGTGTHQVGASYAGDSNYSSSVSNSTVALTAQQGTPTVTVTPSSGNVSTGQALTVMVTVSGVSGVTPTGSVTLTSGSYSSATTMLSNGSATIAIPAGSLAAGTDTLKGTYGGDGNYSAASGQATVTVTNPTFALSGTAVTISSPGATTGNTSTITVTPGGGFTGGVALTAIVTSSPSGAINPPTLSFGSSTPVTISGATVGTATLTISTTAATSSASLLPRHLRGGWYVTGGVAVAGLFVLGIPRRRRNWLSMLSVVAIFAGVAIVLAGCSGSSNSGGNGGGGTTGNPGTTPGAYTVTVSGSSGALATTTTITVTVQ
jgi:trimeric autotransporter adhesin